MRLTCFCGIDEGKLHAVTFGAGDRGAVRSVPVSVLTAAGTV